MPLSPIADAIDQSALEAINRYFNETGKSMAASIHQAFTEQIGKPMALAISSIIQQATTQERENQ